jgi:ketosteroid isomerase-like protein
MDLDDMKRTARTMAENGVDPALVTDDFEYTLEAHPSSHPAAGRPHSAREILSGLDRANEAFRYPDEYGPGDGFKTVIRSITAEGDRVVVETETHAVPRANPAGRYTNYIVAIYVFRDGKVARARIYEDTAFWQAFQRGDPRVMAEINTAAQA